MKKSIRIGGASGYWGESAMATPQLLQSDDLDYLVYDYLAEITMSILARAKAKDPAAGYATDFASAVIRPFARQIASAGVKVIANAGGLNPQACGQAVRKIIAEQGLDLNVAVITGDDLTENKGHVVARAPTDMYSGTPCPSPETIASINAYTGAFPIAAALGAGANIVITGRCVDSAVTLGACIHEFGWDADEWDLLAAGSLAGHLIECGPQVTGGNFTDWEDAGDIASIGYPIAEIRGDGTCTISKPEGTSGLVSIGTVSEQLLYEIGDPQAYLLPDVTCDFSEVRLEQFDKNKVRVIGAKGRPAPEDYKTCLTYADGYRAGTYLTFYGFDAEAKARHFADAAVKRAETMMRFLNIGEFSEISTEIIGTDSQFGSEPKSTVSREVVAKLAVKHPDIKGAGLFLREIAGLGLATPPGLSTYSGSRAKPSPVIRLFSFLTPKAAVSIQIDTGGEVSDFAPFASSGGGIAPDKPIQPELPADAETEVPLIQLAWGRSGDKGDKANIGIIARKDEYLPYIWSALTEERVASVFSHFLADQQAVERFYLPGPKAINFVLDNVLGGGGVASLRNDPQGKGYAQILLACPIPVSTTIAEAL